MRIPVSANNANKNRSRRRSHAARITVIWPRSVGRLVTCYAACVKECPVIAWVPQLCSAIVGESGV